MKDRNEYFIGLAKAVATKSKDRSVQTGAVIVDLSDNIRGTGYNGFARHVNDYVESRHERPTKYLWTEHAERNAIYAAARIGVSVASCSMFCTHAPCCDCARGIIQAGIDVVYYPAGTIMERFKENIAVAHEMMTEAGVLFFEVSP